ncbi:MAG: hypothetical protein ABI977_32715 [Acidobacteriota bacterium]
MPSSMKSVCEGCGGEILYEKNSTGEEIIEANPDDYTNLCGTCRATHHNSKVENAEAAADFEDDRNKAMRTGGE